MPGVTAPLCDRNAALADDVRLYGGIGAGAEAGLLGLCGKTAEELAATFQNGVASSTLRLHGRRSRARSSAVFGHEHTLGKTFRLTLDPGHAEADGAARHPDVELRLADELRAREAAARRSGPDDPHGVLWDRSLDPNRAPKYIVFAEGTEDEMCFATYAIIPDEQS